MNTELLQHEEFGELRMQYIDDEPWFVAKDICGALGLTNHKQATASLDEDEKGVISNDPLEGKGGKQEMIHVNESGLYQLIFKSRKAKAKKFTRWVTSEVLPALRKEKTYTLSQVDNQPNQCHVIIYNAREKRYLADKFMDIDDKQERVMMMNALNDLMDSVVVLHRNKEGFQKEI